MSKTCLVSLAISDHRQSQEVYGTSLALWCASSSDVQQMLATRRPEQFFAPPYVAHLGLIGVRLDRDLGWDENEGVIRNAYEIVAQRMSRPRHSVTQPRAPAAKARRST